MIQEQVVLAMVPIPAEDRLTTEACRILTMGAGDRLKFRAEVETQP